MMPRRWPGALLGAAAVLAAGLAWPWPAVDHAPVGSIRGAAASTIRLRPPVSAAWYRAGGAPMPWGAWSAAAASEAESWLDVTGQGRSLAEVGAGTGWTTAGWTLAGTGALSLGVAMGAADTVIVRVSGCPSTGTHFAFGAYEQLPDPSRAHWTTAGAGRRHAGWRGTAQDLGGPVTAGVLGIAGGQAYLDGSALGFVPGTGSLPTSHIWIGGISGSYPSYGACTVHAAVRYTDTLTAAQVAAVSAAMAAL